MTNGEYEDPRHEQKMRYWLSDRIQDFVSRYRLSASGSYLDQKYSTDKLKGLLDKLAAREKEYERTNSDISPDPELGRLHGNLQKMFDAFEKSSES